MVRKLYEKGLIEAGGPGGGGGARPSGSVGGSQAAREGYLKGSVEQSIQDRGGYPTRGGSPKMTSQQERMQSREAARQPPDYEKRAARARKFGIKGYAKGGMVKAEERGEPKRSPAAEKREEAREYSK